MLSGTWWILTGPAMTVSHVSVTGYDLPDQARVVRAIQVAAVGGDALHLPSGEIERALAPVPWVEGVQVSHDYPRGLVVRITKAVPGAVAVTDGGGRYLVSRTGRFLQAERTGTTTAAGLPEIRVRGARVGERLPDDGSRAALRVAAAISPDVSSRVRDLRVAGGVLTGRLTGGPEVRFGQPIDLRRKAIALDAILANPEAQADLADADYIDLSAPGSLILGGVERSTEDSTATQDSGSDATNIQP